MRLTRHADIRRTQRGLPQDVVETIYTYGTARRSRGAISLTLDEETIRLAAENDRTRRVVLERYRNAYLIVGSDEQVITLARRMRRFRR